MAAPYLLWSFLGAHRQVLFGVVSDYIAVGLASVAALLILLRRRITVDTDVLLIYVFYLTVCVLSFFFAQIDGVSSYYAMLPPVVYFIVAVTYASYFESKIKLFYVCIVCFTAISSLIVVLSFFFLGLSSWGRVTIPHYVDGAFRYFSDDYSGFTDPNILAYFLGFGLLTGLSVIERKSLNLLFLSVVLFAIYLTMSRSAILAVFISALYLGFSWIWSEKIKIKSLAVFPFLGLVFFVVICVSSLVVGEFLVLNEYPEIRVFSERSDSDRLHRLYWAFSEITSSGLVLLFGSGLGYSSLVKDPHNFFLSTVLDTGVLSLMLLMSIVFLLLYKVRVYGSGPIKRYSTSLVVFFFGYLHVLLAAANLLLCCFDVACISLWCEGRSA